MKSWILALLLLLPFPVLANSLFPLTLLDLNEQCPDTQVSLSNFGGITPAVSNSFNGQRNIIMDAHFLITASHGAAWFVFFHECGHLVSGHSETFQPPDKEDVADCYAANRFVNTFGYSRLVVALKELELMTGKTREHQILECVDK